MRVAIQTLDAEVDLAHIEAAELDIEVEYSGQLFQVFGKQRVVPLRKFGEPIVRQHEGLSLGCVEVFETDRWDFEQAEPLARLITRVASQEFAVAVQQQRHIAAQFWIIRASRLICRVLCLRGLRGSSLIWSRYR